MKISIMEHDIVFSVRSFMILFFCSFIFDGSKNGLGWVTNDESSWFLSSDILE
jgi:hypothetical protein